MPLATRSLDWRPMSHSDASAVTALINKCYEEAGSDLRVSRADVDQRYRGGDLGADSLIAVDARGAVLAGGFINEAFEFQGQLHTLLMGFVDPQHRSLGLGRRILRWQLYEGQRRYRMLRPELPGLLKAECSDDEGARLFRRYGMKEVSRLVRIEYDTRSAGPGVPDPPRGVVITPYSDQHAGQVRMLFNDIFHGHWMSKPHTRESWEAEVTRSAQFRAEYSFLAIAGDHVVGFILIYSIPEADVPGRRALGIRGIGTKGSMRSRGLGLLLAQAAAAAIHTDGRYDIVRASMEAMNSPVLQVAERAGAKITGHTSTYARVLPPPGGPADSASDEIGPSGEEGQAS